MKKYTSLEKELLDTMHLAYRQILALTSVIVGDLLLAKYDPRISLTADKGGGR